MYLQVILALLCVIGSIGIIAFLVHRLKKLTFYRTKNSSELCIQEIIQLDIKKKLLIVDYKHKSYILLLGNNDLLVDMVDNENAVSKIE